MNNIRTTLRRLLFLAALIVAIVTVISAWEGMFDPKGWWFISIWGLFFPILFILNFLLLVLSIFFHRKALYITAAAFLLTVVKVPALVQFNSPASKPETIDEQNLELNLVSFNVRLFDLYNWSHNRQTRSKIFNFLEGLHPDIICFQEFYSSERENMNNEHDLKPILNMPYSHVEYPVNRYTTDHYGIATFSRYPIVHTGVLYLERTSTNICIYTDIRVDADTIRIYNCHLQSVRFGTEDYKFLEDIRKSGQDSDAIRKTRTILGRLKRAFIIRAVQAEMIANHLKSSPYPVILCGDFNDTALSFAYKKIAGNLMDAFRESGWGIGRTYAGPIPGLRIDFILHSEILKSYGYRTHKVKLSDHYPIEATFVIKH